MGKRYLLAASLICADPLNLQAEIERLEAGQIDYIHFDPMDGHFVPRLGLYPEILQKLKTITKLPVDVHLMMSDPEFYAPVFAKAGADVIMVHAEANPHLYRVIKNVKNLGVQVGVCLNPATPLSVLDYVLDEIDWVMLMAINPGIVGHGLIPKMLDKISELKAKLANHPNIKIEIDGGVTPDSAAQMIKRGADMLVCGTSSIFKPDLPVDKKIAEFRLKIDNDLK